MEMLLHGALIGLSIALPPGPNAAVCISRTLAAGRRVGFRCGLGAASAHACYAALALAGVSQVSRALGRNAVPLHAAAGLMLVVLAVRLARSGPSAPQRSSRGPYLTTLAVGLANPLTVVYFTAAMAAGAIPAGGGPLVVVGVFAGSAVWWTALTFAVGVMKGHLGNRHLAWAKRVTAAAIGVYGLMVVAVVP